MVTKPNGTDDPYIGVVENGLEEARRTHDKQFELSNRLNDEAIDVIKIDLILLGLLIAAVRLAPENVPDLVIAVAGVPFLGHSSLVISDIVLERKVTAFTRMTS